MRRHLLVWMFLATLTGCGRGGGDAEPAEATSFASSFDRKALLTASADCAIAQYRDFAQAAAALRSAADAHVAAGSAQSSAALQSAWRTAMASWQIAEQYQFGPAAPSSEPGGQDLRDSIHAWPLVSRCKIDEQLVSRLYAQPGFRTSLVSARGLTAIEYLAFHAGSDNGCSAFSTINAQGTWAAIPPAQLARRKAEYAAAAAADVLSRAQALLNAWEPAGGNYRARLVEAGTGSPLFATAQAGLNSVSNAIFYVDKVVKDAKLARPLGLMDCPAATCPQAFESPYARDSRERVEANLLGLERLVLGCGGGPGFDDWLIAADAGELAGRLTTAMAEARAALVAVGPSFEQALASEPARLAALHARLKAVTDLLKAELVSVLDLELPRSVESDND